MKQKVVNLEDIFDLIRSGKRKEGIEFLYSYHYNKLFGIAFLFVKNKMDAEDVVSNSIYKLLNLDIHLFPESHISTWLFTFVKNEALMFLRKEKPSISIDKVLSLSTADQQIENYVNMDAYYSMIKDLSEEQRQIVTLKVLGGYTHKEIAEMLEKPIGTIQWIYNISIKKLKYVLSSFMACMAIFLCGFATKLSLFLYKIYKSNTDSTDKPFKNIAFDYSIIIFAFLFVVTFVIFVIYLKKQDRQQKRVDNASK